METSPIKIVTLAFVTHGLVINLDLSLETSKIFENVRFFSKPGDFKLANSSILEEHNILNKINALFQKNLTNPTSDLLEEYINYSKPKYKSYLNYYGELTPENSEKVCSQFSNITYDKLLSVKENFFMQFSRGLFNMLTCNPRGDQGIFVVSIHEKNTADNNYRLLYPNSETRNRNLNLIYLSEFNEFARILGKELPDLRDFSTILSSQDFRMEEEVIQNNPMLTNEEKQMRTKQIREQFFRILNEWKIQLAPSNRQIESIKLSFLIELIKDIVGRDECKINILDFGCNGVTDYVPERQTLNKQYMVADDIEQGPCKSWGGKTKNKGKGKIRVKNKGKTRVKNKGKKIKTQKKRRINK